MGTFIRSTFISTDTSAPKVVPLYAQDTFNRANSATPGRTEKGNYTWEYPAGTYYIEDKVLLSGETIGKAPADCWINPGQTEGILTMSPQKVGSGFMSGILFRKSTTNNTAFVFYASPSKHMLAQRTASDAFTVITATGPDIPFTQGEVMTVELTAAGKIICAVNGVVTHEVTNTTYLAQTSVGVTTRASTAASPAGFDNWSFSAR